MSESLETRMANAFRSVFVELSEAPLETVKKAEKESMSSWDSANHLLLITVLEDEFSVRIPESKATILDSFITAAALIKSFLPQGQS